MDYYIILWYMQSVWNKLIMIRHDETSVKLSLSLSLKVKRYRKHNQCKSETNMQFQNRLGSTHHVKDGLSFGNQIESEPSFIHISTNFFFFLKKDCCGATRDKISCPGL